MRHGLLTSACFQVVAPRRAALQDANKRLHRANKELTGIHAKVKELKDRVAYLEESLTKVCNCSCRLQICNVAGIT